MPPKFARVPENVLADTTLTHRDIRAYAAISLHAINKRIVHVGQRRLAELAQMDRRALRICLENLGKAGHISTSTHKLGRRGVYRLNSDIFSNGQKGTQNEDNLHRNQR